MEEQRLKTLKDGEERKDSGWVSVGPKSFGSSVEKFEYFMRSGLLLNVNKVSKFHFLFFFLLNVAYSVWFVKKMEKNVRENNS